MKTKFLLLNAILFYILGLHFHDELVYYFFTLLLVMLYIAVVFHKRELKVLARRAAKTPAASKPSKS